MDMAILTTLYLIVLLYLWRLHVKTIVALDEERERTNRLHLKEVGDLVFTIHEKEIAATRYSDIVGKHAKTIEVLQGELRKHDALSHNDLNLTFELAENDKGNAP